MENRATVLQNARISTHKEMILKIHTPHNGTLQLTSDQQRHRLDFVL